MGLLDGKVVIITGAGGGIGRAEALLFAREGASVVVNDVGGSRDGTGSSEAMASIVVHEITQAGGRAVANFDSVATNAGASNILKTALDAFGRVDVLVNNAGILRDKTLLKMDEDLWDSVIEVHLKGTFLCTQTVVRQMIAQGGGGRIVNTTSVSGMLGNFGQSNYAAAKAGIYGFTRTAAIELQKHRITVNALAPIAKTRMTEDLPMFQSAGDTMTPDHVAPAALFLASDLCADRTGHVLAVAGQQGHAGEVDGESERGDAHHGRCFRSAAGEGAAEHLQQRPGGQCQLQPAGQAGRALLVAGGLAHCEQSHAVDGGIGKHVQRVGDQPGGLGPPAGQQLDDEHRGVEPQQPAQHPGFVGGRCRRFRQAGIGLW